MAAAGIKVMVSAKKRVGGVEFTANVHIRVNLLTTLFISICVMCLYHKLHVGVPIRYGLHSLRLRSDLPVELF